MRHSVCRASAWIHHARVAAAVLAIVCASVPALGQGAGDAGLRPNLTLVDEALRMRVARGDLTAAQADAELKRRAVELASRESPDDRDPELPAEHRLQAAAFFSHVEQAIRSASRWPTDQPPEKYESRAIGQLEQARSDYGEAIRAGKDPRDALRLAQQVLAWTRGEAQVPADRDVFAGEDDRIAAALQPGAAAGSPPSAPPAVVAEKDPAPPADGEPPAVAAQPAVVSPPEVAAPAAAGAEAIENSPTYMPKDEALEHKRKADESEDLETSLREIQAALKIEPRFAPWWNNLGELMAEHARWQEAEAAFSRAAELNPNEPEFRANLALALLRLGRREDAIKQGSAASALAREQKNAMHGSHPVYQELGLPQEAAPPPVAAEVAPPAPVAGKEQKAYRGLKFSVTGVKRVKEHEGSTAEAGNEFVVVSTVIDRSEFKSDFRGNECKLDRAKLRDAADEVHKSMENQLRITESLRNEDGTLAGTQALPYDWGFEVPEGTRLKTFEFVFADEHVGTGGEDPDENVTELSFSLE